MPGDKFRPFPDISLPDLDGKPVRVLNYRGKNLLIFAWGSW